MDDDDDEWHSWRPEVIPLFSAIRNPLGATSLEEVGQKCN